MPEREHLSKSEQAYAWLRRQIEAGVFGPGYRLVLADLARDLDMSVVPVREAIRRLEAERLVTFERNVGARISMVNETDYIDTMQAMGIIEAAATALALPYLSAEDLGEAEKVNATMAMLLDHFDATVFTQLNHRFHAWLYEPCPNAHLVGLVRRGWSQLSGLRTSTFDYVPDRAALSVREHTEILAMIRDHASPADIEMAVRQHRWRTLEAYLERRSPAEAPTARGGDGVPGPAPHPREVHHG